MFEWRHLNRAGRRPQHFRKIEDVPLQKLVHSLAVDPSTHRVYAPEQEENAQPVARIVVYEPRNK
jgi:hypothetical protein